MKRILLKKRFWLLIAIVLAIGWLGFSTQPSLSPTPVSVPQTESNQPQQTDKSDSLPSASNRTPEQSSLEPSEPATTGTTVVRTAHPNEVVSYAGSHNLTIEQITNLPDGQALITIKQNPQSTAIIALSQTIPDTKAGPNAIYRALLTPNDPLYPQQWFSEKVSLASAWDVTTGSSSVKVAVIDTGFALSHQDLTNRWATNSGENGVTINEGSPPNCTSRSLVLDKSCNNLDDDGNGRVDDWRGWDFCANSACSTTDNDPSTTVISHGTETAGLVGAEANNSLGVAGTNWLSPIVPLKVLNDSGVGYTSGVVSALAYARALGVKVSSLSLGSSSPDPLLEDEINSDIAAGITVVAAAGNCGDTDSSIIGCNSGEIIYPANYANVIAVGATDSNDNRASFSSFGANLDIMAPGTGSLRSPTIVSGNTTSAYASALHGTSYSAPIVSGVAALMYARFPSITPAQIADGLTVSADKVAAMNGANRTDQYGYGRLNAKNALKIDTLPCPYPVLRNYNNGALPSGQRIVAYRYGSGPASYLTYTQLNNTGSACTEAHVWNPYYTSWLTNIATGLRASNPASGMLISSWSRVDSQVSLNYVTYGNVEVHRFSPSLQKLPGYYDVPTNLTGVSPSTGTFVAGDFLGAGYDQLVYILYAGNNGGMEIHMFNPAMTSAIGFYDLPTGIGAVNNGVFVAGDFLGRGYAQLAYVSYGNTEVHLLDIRGGKATRVYEVPTELTGTSSTTGTFVAGDFLGRGYAQLIYIIYNNGHGGCANNAGCVETHMFDPRLISINRIQDIVTNLTGFTP